DRPVHAQRRGIHEARRGRQRRPELRANRSDALLREGGPAAGRACAGGSDRIDLFTRSGEVFTKLGEAGSADLNSAPTDRTHFSEKGARLLAGLVLADQIGSTCSRAAARYSRSSARPAAPT